jgi:hypothetical protein
MENKLLPRAGPYAGVTIHNAWSWMPLALMAALVSALALHAVLFGPGIRERAERLQAEQTDRENRALCEKLGIHHGSERFGGCADVLSEVRRLEAYRISREVAGIL